MHITCAYPAISFRHHRKTMDKLDRTIFNRQNCINIGFIRSEFVDFFNTHGFKGLLKHDSPIVFWKDRVEHTDAHRDEFSSDIMYQICFEEIPQIIYRPDYISIHPKENSISFIRNYTSNHVNVAIRVTVSGNLAYRTMYPLVDATLTHYMDTSHAWKVEYSEDGTPTIIDKAIE